MIWGCLEFVGEAGASDCATWVVVANAEPWLTVENAAVIAGAAATLWAIAWAGSLMVRALLQSSQR